MKYITKEVRIGIAGIIALCVLIYGINWLKGIHMFQLFLCQISKRKRTDQIKSGICRRCPRRYCT